MEQKVQNSVIQESLLSLDDIHGKLDTCNSKLNNLSIKAGVRNYYPTEDGEGLLSKSPENQKEYLYSILSEINIKLNLITERITELECFI